MTTSLAGMAIAVTADRRADEQAALLSRRAATVVHGPVLRTLAVDPAAGVDAATDELIDQPPDVVALTTGIGVRGWLSAAEASGRADALLTALGQARVVARGPKAAGAAAMAGLVVAWQAPGERSEEVVDHLVAAGVAGMRVAVQLDGGPRVDVPGRLRAAGADVVPVPVYRWTEPVDPAPARRVVAAVADRTVDAVTFTSAPAVDRFFAVAAEEGCRDAVLAALAGPVVAACVGPVSAEAAVTAGVVEPVVPRRARLGAMVQALVVRLQRDARAISVHGTDVVVRPRAAVVDGRAVPLPDREAAVLAVLAERPGAVVPKRVLLERVWGDAATDEHAVEVAVARLRRRLGPAGAGIETAVRRGYRLAP